MTTFLTTLSRRRWPGGRLGFVPQPDSMRKGGVLGRNVIYVHALDVDHTVVHNYELRRLCRIFSRCHNVVFKRHKLYSGKEKPSPVTTVGSLCLHGVGSLFGKLIMHIVHINRMNLCPSVLGHVVQVVDPSRCGVTMCCMVNGSLS